MDMILHFLIGMLIVSLLRETTLNFATGFFILASVALGKELYDHTFIMGHIECYTEHIKDIVFTIIPGIILAVKDFRRNV